MGCGDGEKTLWKIRRSGPHRSALSTEHRFYLSRRVLDVKVAMLSGSWPPDRCGVGDYAERLSVALTEHGVEVVRLGDSGFGVASIPAINRRLADCGADILHIQYPTVGYGRSIAPALLAALPGRWPVVATLHEFASFRSYRLPWFIPYARRADTVVFTNGVEHDAFRTRLRSIRAHTEIIPIGSNIPTGPGGPRKERSVCYFGLIMPGKGLEQVLELARLLVPKGFEVTVIGSVPPHAASYGADLVNHLRSAGARIFLDEEPAGVAALLGGQSYAFLPFPDGASDKRGSLLAAIVNGVRVVAPLGVGSSAPICDWIMPAQDAAEAARLLANLADGVTAWTGGTPGDRVTRYQWGSIAERHAALYSRVAGRNRRPNRSGKR